VEPSETRYSTQIQVLHPADHHLGMSWNPRKTTFIQSRASSPYATNRQAKEEASRQDADQRQTDRAILVEDPKQVLSSHNARYCKNR
jgi:hypothetical protein